MSKVYFTDYRVHDVNADNIPAKLARLMKAAGFEKIKFTDRFAALKIHFGEPGNMSYLRPNYARTVAEYVKKLGGKPFLTDCNTLYVGRRKNALDHLDAAYENGYSPFSGGAQVIIADGLKGTDEVEVDVPNGQFVKKAKIGRAVMDADILISMAHFKMHELTGIGGTIKNVGMGCGSRAGKMEMHSSGKPKINAELCVGCGICKKNCAHNALTLSGKKMTINLDKCAGCGRCLGLCFRDAIEPTFDEGIETVGKKIAEYSAAVLAGRPQFHLNFVCDVVPFCDCHDSNDMPIVADIGIFASTDPVAVDKAAADAVNAAGALPGSLLDQAETRTGDHFKDIHPTTDWLAVLRYAESIGLGSLDYEIATVK